MNQQPAQIDYAGLMGEVEELVSVIEDAEGRTATIHAAAEAIIAKFRDQLGITGGRIYRYQDGQYVLLGVFGEARQLPEGLVVPESYPPVQSLLEQRTLFMEADNPQVDRDLESYLGAERFAAIEVGDQDFILAFDVEPGRDRTGILHSLGILRSSINQRIRQERMEDVLRQARRIQASIFPRKPPQVAGFEIFGLSQPMEIVGGDYFDFIELSEGLMGIAIADVSGHGLPAALLVRDVHVGLRMGLAKEYKITHTLERLNAIINRSRLTSRFVSMFYAELEPRGTVIYVNAGHPSPLFMTASGEDCFLEMGGAVLGPIADVRFERGFARMNPGDLIVMYTDGILEASPENGSDPSTEFGTDRLVQVLRQHRERPAEEIVKAVFGAVENYCGTDLLGDDRTVVVVKRLD